MFQVLSLSSLFIVVPLQVGRMISRPSQCGSLQLLPHARPLALAGPLVVPPPLRLVRRPRLPPGLLRPVPHRPRPRNIPLLLHDGRLRPLRRGGPLLRVAKTVIRRKQ